MKKYLQIAIEYCRINRFFSNSKFFNITRKMKTETQASTQNSSLMTNSFLSSDSKYGGLVKKIYWKNTSKQFIIINWLYRLIFATFFISTHCNYIFSHFSIIRSSYFCRIREDLANGRITAKNCFIRFRCLPHCSH